jgi:hypothetical protein
LPRERSDGGALASYQQVTTALGSSRRQLGASGHAARERLEDIANSKTPSLAAPSAHGAEAERVALRERLQAVRRERREQSSTGTKPGSRCHEHRREQDRQLARCGNLRHFQLTQSKASRFVPTSAASDSASLGKITSKAGLKRPNGTPWVKVARGEEGELLGLYTIAP